MSADTSREAVERLAFNSDLAERPKTAATLRALLAEREAALACAAESAAIMRRMQDRLEAERDAARAEVADLKTSVVAFAAPWAVEYARDHGLPPGHLHQTHYDILEKAGARMDSFTRAALAGGKHE